MNKRLQKLLAQRAAAVTRMRAILDAAEAADNRELTAEETTEYGTLEASITALDEKIKREQRLVEIDRTAPAIQEPGASRTPRVSNVHNRAGDQPFASLGEQLMAIAQVGTPGQATEDTLARLHGVGALQGAASGASAASGPDGGFLIQRDFATDLVNSGIETGVLSSRCSETNIGEGSDGLEVVTIDETSRADGSRWGGVRVYRRAEAETVAASKPKFGTWERRLEDMMGIAYVTDRALRDAPALGGVFQEAYNDEFGFKIDTEIHAGTGVGECLGFTKSDALVTVDEEAGQIADTIVAANVIKMWARLPLRNRKNAIWLYNLECEPQLMQMTIGAGAGIIPVWMPPGGLSGQPFATIFGRPALPIEQASALGDAGDISVVDLTQYKLIRKGGIQSDESIHVRFIYGERAFRWITAINGAPKWRKPLTPYKGASTYSPFVTLAARA